MIGIIHTYPLLLSRPENACPGKEAPQADRMEDQPFHHSDKEPLAMYALTQRIRIFDTGGESSMSDNRVVDFRMRRKQFSKAVVLSGRKRGCMPIAGSERYPSRSRIRLDFGKEGKLGDTAHI